jgi:PAS domain-containing protein
MRGDDLLNIIEAIHAAGLDSACWPRALQLTTEALDGVGATFEVLDKTRFAHTAFYSFGIPPAHQLEYADHYLAVSPRVRAALRHPNGHVHWDYQILDEAEMGRDPFYADFLPRLGMRYAVAGTIRQTDDEFAAFAVQRSAKQGHVGRREIALMRRLVPHVQQAFDVARRLKGTGDARESLERTLDWLSDGVALVRADGKIMHANESFQTIARRNDGIRIRKGLIEFADAEAYAKFNGAVASVLRLRAGQPDSPAADFTAARSAGAQPYFVSVRPLLGKPASQQPSQAVAMVFVRDPQGARRCGNRRAARPVRAHRSRGRARSGPAVGRCA